MVLITQTEVNAVFDEQVKLCADTLQKKTKEYTGWEHLSRLLLCSTQHPSGRLPV